MGLQYNIVISYQVQLHQTRTSAQYTHFTLKINELLLKRNLTGTWYPHDVFSSKQVNLIRSPPS